MPPKPFKAPRPSGSGEASGKKAGRSKGNASREAFKDAVTKPARAANEKAKGKGYGKERMSAIERENAATSKGRSIFEKRGPVKENIRPRDSGASNASSSRLSGASVMELSTRSEDEDAEEEEEAEGDVDGEEEMARDGRPGPEDEFEDEDDPFASQQPRRSSKKSNALPEPEPDRETIPPALLTALLQQFFQRDGTRISKGANKAVVKYMDTFVREAIARAAWVREGDGDIGAMGGEMLEVEHLEKLAPQLVLDF